MANMMINNIVAGIWPVLDSDGLDDLEDGRYLAIVDEHPTLSFNEPLIPFQILAVDNSKIEDAKKNGFIDLEVESKIGFSDDVVMTNIRCKYIEDYFKK